MEETSTSIIGVPLDRKGSVFEELMVRTSYQIPFLLVLFSSLASAQAPTIGGCTVLPADNIWNTPVDQLPVAPTSSTYITTIGPTGSVHADFGSGIFDGGTIGIPFIT